MITITKLTASIASLEEVVKNEQLSKEEKMIIRESIEVLSEFRDKRDISEMQVLMILLQVLGLFLQPEVIKMISKFLE